MRVLVTGISGFVGTHLVAHLGALGDEVAGTYAGAAPDLPGVDLHPIDIVDADAMTELVEQVDPEVILHLAGLSHVGDSWNRPGKYFQVNVLGTEHLLTAARGRRVVLASSAEVYGLVPEAEQPIREEQPLAPASPYAMTKAAAERLVAGAGGVIARTFNLIGPGQAAHFALPAFARQLADIRRGRLEARLRVGNLSARRDFVHVCDGARAFRLLAERGQPGEAYNIASGRASSIAELLDRLRGVAGVEARVETDLERMRPVDIPVLAGDASRLRALGWEPEFTLEDAVRELWISVRDEPEAPA